MSLRRKQITTLVNNLLSENNITKAAVPVSEIARKLGATIIFERNDNDELSGFLLRDREKNQIIIGVNGNHPENRQRFTISHEIGHLLLHSEETFHIDKSSEGFGRKAVSKFERNKESATGASKIEREANLFAAELLMPSLFIERDMAKLGDIDLLHDKKLEKLAEDYGVSIQALTYRLNNLGYIQL